MGIKSDLEAEVKTIFADKWEPRDGQKVPEPEDLTLGNTAIKLDAAVLYADMSDSTILVDSKTPYFAAEVYKSYLICAARIVKIAFGAITAYDGDRIMAVFIGNDKEERAVRSALRINYATSHIINPAIEAQYGAGMYTLRQVVGIDTSEIVAARIGVRKYNDLVWVGHAANHAAKLSGLSDYPTYITAAVHSQLPTSLTNVGGKDVWEARFWTPMNNERIYRSNWHCALT